jgi:hypothetical protein
MIQSGFYIFIEIYRNLSFFFEKLAEFIVFFEKNVFDKWTPSSFRPEEGLLFCIRAMTANRLYFLRNLKYKEDRITILSGISSRSFLSLFSFSSSKLKLNLMFLILFLTS